MLASQYWGKGDRRAVERVMGLSLRVTLLISLVFALAAAIFPEGLMRIFTNDPELISEGIGYLRAVSPAYVLGGFATVYLCVMRSVERVKMSAAVHCSAVLMNVLLNACFIFGIAPSRSWALWAWRWPPASPAWRRWRCACWTAPVAG